MISKYLFFIFALTGLSQIAAAQDSYIISGKIADSLNSQSLAGASIRVKGTSSGTVAREDGQLPVEDRQKIPFCAGGFFHRV